MSTRGVRKIDEKVIGIGRTLITTEESSFDSVEPGTIFIDPKNGKVKVKVEGEKTWSKMQERGVYVGNNPPTTPEPGDLWLDTNTNIEIDEKDLDFSGGFLPGMGKGSVNEEEVKKIIKETVGENGVSFITDLSGTVTITSSCKSVKFISGNIDKYMPESDVLIVKQGITVLTKDVHYSINADNGTITNLNGNWEASTSQPITFNFIILRNSFIDKKLVNSIKDINEGKVVIASRAQGSLELRSSTNSINFVGLGNIKSFDPSKGDTVRVYMNTTALTENKHYRLSSDNQSIIKIDGHWDGSTKPILFDFDVLQNQAKKVSLETQDLEDIKKLKDNISQISKTVNTIQNNDIQTNKKIEEIKNKQITAKDLDILPTAEIKKLISTSETNTKKYIDEQANALRQYINSQIASLRKNLETVNIITDSVNNQQYKLIVEDGKPKLEVVK